MHVHTLVERVHELREESVITDRNITEIGSLDRILDHPIPVSTSLFDRINRGVDLFLLFFFLSSFDVEINAIIYSLEMRINF